ncbi:MAG: GGDEF domain-containing protein [Sneathiella sp.]
MIMKLMAQKNTATEENSFSAILHTIFEKTEIGGIVLNSDRRVAIWNQKMVSYSGISREDAYGEALDTLFENTLLARFTKAIDQAMRKGMSSVLTHKFHGLVMPLFNLNGGQLLYTVYVKPLNVDNSGRWCLIEIHDVTNVEEREARLRDITLERRESETRLRLLTDNLPAVIHQVTISDDGEKEASFLSRGVEQLFSIDYDFACQEPDFLRSYVVAHDIDRFDEAVSEAMGRCEERDVVVRIAVHNRSTKWVHAFFRARENHLGQTILEGLYLDVTAEKISEGELRRHATVDSLTGIYNRRYLLELSEREFKVACRYASPLSILVIDVDHFKAVNDTHGHDKGDDVLAIVAQTIQSALRQSDIFGRLGGEEFVVTLPHASASAAYTTAEKLRQKIEKTKFGKKGLSVTVSIGVAEIKPSDDTISATLKRADLAVYEAKRVGRNCVVADYQIS